MLDPVQFLLAALTLLIAPGPTNTVMATAGAGSARSPLPLLAAELLGYLAIIAVARVALLPLIEFWPPAGTLIKLAVVAYLVVAAVRLWGRQIAIGASENSIGFGTVFLTTFLNPKGLILAVAVVPWGHPQLWAHAAVFAALVGGCGFAWFMLGRGIGTLAGARASILPRVAAIALLLFAALVAVSVGR